MPRWPIRTEAERAAHLKATKREKDARYYAKHKAEINAKNALYFVKNRERMLEIMKKYRLENRQSINEKVREWQDNNREYLRKKNMEWHKANPERIAEKSRERRARLARADGSHTADDIKRLWLLQRATCACCRKKISRKTAHIDHIIPLALGGSNYANNLQLLCVACNTSKGAKAPVDFMQSRGFLL